MKILGIVFLLVTSIGLGQCPLGYSPDQACPADDPTCALFNDGNDDGRCDNAAPPGEDAAEEEPEAEETIPEVSEEEPPPEPDEFPPSPMEEPPRETSTHTSSAPSVPEPEEESEAGSEPIVIGDLVKVTNNFCGAPFCLDPRSSVTGGNVVIWEFTERVTDSSRIVGKIQVKLLEDSVRVDTVVVEETVSINCPMKFTPEEACAVESPICAFFTDTNGDGFCDNPGLPGEDTVRVSGREYGLVPVAGGCPLGLPPEIACPTPETRLCAHYRDKNGCVNPRGGGMARAGIILAATFVLLGASTLLKKHLCGRGRKMRKKRTIAHVTVQVIALLVLGFFVQGCFCPIGLIQYIMLPSSLVFLGLLGIGILILPMLWSLFFDRIYCGWVCPFGALQDLLGKIPVPRPPKIPRRIHNFLAGLKYLLVILFIGFAMLITSGYFPKIALQPFFCNIDPFHTVFSLFVVGSLAAAVISMSFLIFFPRFFCKYLCFYGAILSFFGRVGLWNRINSMRLPTYCDDDEEADS